MKQTLLVLHGFWYNMLVWKCRRQKNSLLTQCFCRCMGGVAGKMSYSHFCKHRNSFLNMSSFLNIVCHNFRGKNNTIYNQSHRKRGYKKLKIQTVTKIQQCFTIFQYQIELPKNIEISTPNFLGVWLFWCEIYMLYPNPGWLPSKFVIKTRD